MPAISTKSGVSAYGFTSFSEVLGGMALLSPRSISYTGTSANIVGDGSIQVDCSSISLNQIFGSNYSNYVLVMTLSATQATVINARLRLDGVDSSTGYSSQNIKATGSSIIASRTDNNVVIIGSTVTNVANLYIVHIYGPYAPARTTFYTMENSNGLSYRADQHESTTQYDSLTISAESGSISGLVSMYGIVSS